MRLCNVLTLCAVTLAGAAKPAVGPPRVAPPVPAARWVYLATNLLVDANVDSGIWMLGNARKLGYNGVMVADSKFCRWGEFGGRYAANCARFRDAVRKLGLKFVVCVAPIGYSNDLLGKDPNLAEGLPVIDAPFVATADRHLVPQEEHPLKNGGFEDANGDSPAGWNFVDQPGKICVLDHANAAEGHTSLRMADIGKLDPTAGHARAEQTLHLHPFRYYHVSLKVKTQDFDTPGATQILALGENGQALQFVTPPIRRTMPWTQVDVTFNTLNNSTVNFYIGVWGGRGGTIWWDDVNIEPAGLTNLVRRSGAPLTAFASDGTQYVEHTDFDGATDPKLGNNHWLGDFDAWHVGPTMTVPVGSRIRPGDTVRVSYFHAALIYDGQTTMCMAEPKTRALLTWQIEQVHKNLAPDGYMLSHDEIRIGGWDASCAATHETPGQMLADNVKFCIDTVRREDPGREILAWSDMFDPTHNAKANGAYYLVKGEGPWNGAWTGLDKNVTIVNWQSDPATRRASLDHFAAIGCHQLLAGYYDGRPDAIIGWLRDAATVKGVAGVMYTTWIGSYTDLAAFARAAQAGG